jgi:hypothetical protein
MSDKKSRERYYTTMPKYVTRVVARKWKRELVGWGFEVRDGNGAILAWSTIIYKTPEEAYQQARERFGECDHDFEPHYGTPVFGGRAMAWLLGRGEIEMWRCTKCGEQGYEIKEEVS